nr:nucleic acid-binding, OB-fold protein [Tanacetum cinerariifolium]
MHLVNGISNFEDPNRSQSIRRKINIENLNGNIIEFTLWDEMAEHFEQADLEKMEQLVIIAVSSCRISKDKRTSPLTLIATAQPVKNQEQAQKEKEKSDAEQGDKAEDREFARRINVLLQEMTATRDDMVDFVQEIEAVPGVIMVIKTAEFLNETLVKEDRSLQKS